MPKGIQDFHRAPNDLVGFLGTNEILFTRRNHFISSVYIRVYLWFLSISVVLTKLILHVAGFLGFQRVFQDGMELCREDVL